MAKRLFVGGLPYATTDQELNEFFATIGKVASATVITDKYTNQGKGFGFVEYEDDADAEKAIKELTGKDYGGRKIVVNEARPREESPAGGGYGRRGGGDSRGSRRW